MSIKTRLDALEDGAAGALPVLMLSRGITNDNLFYGPGDTTYTEGDIPDLEKQYQLIIMSWDGWPYDGSGKQMTWGDDYDQL